MKEIGMYTGKSVKSLYEAYNCRICKIKLTEENFGDLGYNHGIFCKTCLDNGEVDNWNNHFKKMYER